MQQPQAVAMVDDSEDAMMVIEAALVVVGYDGVGDSYKGQRS